MSTLRSYKSTRQGKVIYDSKYILEEEMKEFDQACRTEEPDRLWRVVTHCERIRKNGSWRRIQENLGGILKYRRDLLKSAEEAGWKVIRTITKDKYTNYILVSPISGVDPILIDCHYRDHSAIAELTEEFNMKNNSIAEHMQI